MGAFLKIAEDMLNDIILGWVGGGPPLLHELHDGRPLVGVAALLVAHLEGAKNIAIVLFADFFSYYSSEKIEG